MENKIKYAIVIDFMRLHVNDKVIVVGDMNAHIGILGERMNVNGAMLRETCEERAWRY